MLTVNLMLSVPGVIHRCTVWKMMDKGWGVFLWFFFLVFWSSFPDDETINFHPLVLGASSGDIHWKQKEYCHYICLVGAAYGNTDLGVPSVGCPKSGGGLNPWGTWAQTFLCSSATCQGPLSASSCSALQVGDLSTGLLCGQSWLPVETLLLTGCLAGSWRPVLWNVSCVPRSD